MGARLKEADLAEEARERRNTGQVHRRNEEQNRKGRGHLGEPTQLVERGGTASLFNQPRHKEERRLHGDVVGDVEDCGGKADLVSHGDTEDHVADMADQREGQQTLEIVLGHGSQDADHHGEQRYPQQHIVQPAVGEEQGLGANDCVHTHLGQQPGEHGGDRCGRRRVGVWKPGGEREDGRLDTERE